MHLCPVCISSLLYSLHSRRVCISSLLYSLHFRRACISSLLYSRCSLVIHLCPIVKHLCRVFISSYSLHSRRVFISSFALQSSPYIHAPCTVMHHCPMTYSHWIESLNQSLSSVNQSSPYPIVIHNSRVAVCCSVLQCVALCCSVLQYVAVCLRMYLRFGECVAT